MKKIFGLLLILVVGYAGVFGLSRWLEHNRISVDETYVDEDLYFSTQQLNLLGADFKGLLADWYWMKSLQYMGDKIIRQQEKTGEMININDLNPLNARLIYPMLDSASTLDPQFLTIYSYGASVLPAINSQKAIHLLEKGIAANPDEWRLYNNLGYIYWQLKNYPRASELYAGGANKPNAPAFMKQMSVSMQAQGGSRDFALQIYRQMFETAEDGQTKTFAGLRYLQTLSLDERDAVQETLQTFKKQNNRCADDWREIFPQLKTIRIKNASLNFDKDSSPVDPSGIPYYLSNRDNNCEIRINSEKSKIPVQ